MPLIECPECKKSVSSEADACPFCGYPVAEKVGAGMVAVEPVSAAGEKKEGELLAEVMPSWWGYFWSLFFFWLIIPPIVAWFHRAGTVLRVYTDRITVERGIFSKCYQDYSPKDIRSIDIDQSFIARLFDIGDLTISTAASAEGSEVLRRIPDPKAVRDLMMSLRRD